MGSVVRLGTVVVCEENVVEGRLERGAEDAIDDASQPTVFSFSSLPNVVSGPRVCSSTVNSEFPIEERVGKKGVGVTTIVVESGIRDR